jgi:membrane protease YdiL (CAAX protease family)
MVRERRRRLPVLLLTLVAAAVLTRTAYRAPVGSSRAVIVSYVLAVVLLAGAVLSGGMPAAHRRGRHPVVGPVLTAVALFVAFALLGEVVRLVPPLRDAVDEVQRRADGGFGLLLAACVTGLAEEVFYRGALFERLPFPLVTVTLAHMATTLPAGNAALTCAAGFLGVVLGTSRRVCGGWFAPAVTHVTWTVLMVTLLR